MGGGEGELTLNLNNTNTAVPAFRLEPSTVGDLMSTGGGGQHFYYAPC